MNPIKWLKRRLARETERDEMEQLMRETFAAAGEEIREAHPEWRQVHGMTVPELQDTRARFDAIVRAEWPTQT